MPDVARSAHHPRPISDDATIAALAKQTHTAHDVVKRLYEEEIAALHDKATVKKFVHVIAGRRVKQRLKAMKAKGRH